MISSLLKLQRTLWWRGLKANQSQIVMMFFFIFYGAFGAIFIGAVGAFQIRDGHPLIFPTIVSMGLLGYAMTVVMMPAGENHLLPESLAGYPVSGTQLWKANVVSALLSSRSVAAVVATLATIVTASFGFGILFIPALLFMMILQLLLVVYSGELIAISLGQRKQRSKKERNTIFASLAFFVIIVGFNLAMNSAMNLPDLDKLGRVLQWTPLGAAGGVVVALFEGRYLAASIQFAVTLASLAAVLWVWRSTISRRMLAPFSSTESVEPSKKQSTKSIPEEEAASVGAGSIFIPGAPRTPLGAVYSRSIRYFRRDSRLLTSMITYPFLIIFFVIQSKTSGSDSTLYAGVVVFALMCGMVASNDYGYDGPANWIHLVSPVRPRTVMLGRHLAGITPLVCVALLFDVIFLLLAKDTRTAAVVVVVAVFLLFGSIACGLLCSVFNPFPTAAAGTNPWQDKSGFSSAAFLTAIISMFLGWLPAAPGAGLWLWGMLGGQPIAAIVGLILLAVLPIGTYILAIRICAERIDSRYPEIFAKVRRRT